MVDSHFLATCAVVVLSAVPWLRYRAGHSVLYAQAVAVFYVVSGLGSLHALLSSEEASLSFLASQMFWVGVGILFYAKMPFSRYKTAEVSGR